MSLDGDFSSFFEYLVCVGESGGIGWFWRVFSVESFGVLWYLVFVVYFVWGFFIFLLFY